MPEKPVIEVPEFITVRNLAELMDASPIDVIKELMNNGVMANINQLVDFDTVAIVGEEMGFEIRPEAQAISDEEIKAIPVKERFFAGEAPEDLKPRPPVVTVLGHVDHGKTKLLDAIRHTNVADQEHGGITQHIGAYQVTYEGKKITFLDTPGHEAFTAMRARGAQGADIAILVVASDDGVMPQTKEAIAHARAAHVPILIALNKIDLSTASPERVQQQLADEGLTPEGWGGDTIYVQISAKQRINIEELLENILLVTDVAELKANPHRPAVGTVVEGRLDKGKGAVATVLVMNGTLKQGDYVVIGGIYGRVRAMFNDKGKRIKKAPPSMPTLIVGLSGVPEAGEILEVVPDDKTAKATAAERAKPRQQAAPPKVLSLDELFSRVQAGEIKELNLIIKADVQGSIEPIVTSLENLGDEDLKVNILHKTTGNITESDIMLAVASKAIVIGFNASVAPAAQRMADVEGVDIRTYNIIYKLIEDIEKALKGLLEPEYQDVVIGRAEVRDLFRIPSVGHVAGVYVTDGGVMRNAQVKVRRGDDEVFDGRVASLKRFQDDVREVKTGYECGVGIANFKDFEIGDILEFYRKEQVSERSALLTQQSMTRRQRRLEELIRQLLSELILRRAQDPRLEGVIITSVEMSADLRHARVLVSVPGDKDAQKAGLAGLRHAAGFLRRELSARLSTRHTPELDFQLDKGLDRIERIDAILAQIYAEDAHPGEPPPA